LSSAQVEAHGKNKPGELVWEVSQRGWWLLLSVCLCVQLPIRIYESLLELVETQPKVLYTPIHYSLATEEAERVGVDHIARSSVTGSAQTSAGEWLCPGLLGPVQQVKWLHYVRCWHSVAVSEQLTAQYGAVKMLHSRVQLILDYLKAVQTGEEVSKSKSAFKLWCVVVYRGTRG